MTFLKKLLTKIKLYVIMFYMKKKFITQIGDDYNLSGTEAEMLSKMFMTGVWSVVDKILQYKYNNLLRLEERVKTDEDIVEIVKERRFLSSIRAFFNNMETKIQEEEN